MNRISIKQLDVIRHIQPIDTIDRCLPRATEEERDARWQCALHEGAHLLAAVATRSKVFEVWLGKGEWIETGCVRSADMYDREAFVTTVGFAWECCFGTPRCGTGDWDKLLSYPWVWQHALKFVIRHYEHVVYAATGILGLVRKSDLTLKERNLDALVKWLGKFVERYNGANLDLRTPGPQAFDVIHPWEIDPACERRFRAFLALPNIPTIDEAEQLIATVPPWTDADEEAMMQRCRPVEPDPCIAFP